MGWGLRALLLVPLCSGDNSGALAMATQHTQRQQLATQRRDTAAHRCPQAHLARASYTKTATHGTEDCDWLPAGPPQTSDTRRVLVPHPRAQPQALQRGHASLPLTDPSLRAGDFHQTAPTELSLLGRSHRFSPCRPGSDAQHRGIISQGDSTMFFSCLTINYSRCQVLLPVRLCWAGRPQPVSAGCRSQSLSAAPWPRVTTRLSLHSKPAAKQRARHFSSAWMICITFLVLLLTMHVF